MAWQWNVISMEPILWRQLSEPWLEANLGKPLRRLTPHQRKKEQKWQALIEEELANRPSWRDFYIANVFEAVPKKLQLRHFHDVRHSHNLLGESFCTSVHI